MGQKFCDECGFALTVAPVAPVESPEPAGGVPELRFVSVLFVDLVGFTSLSEGREAEDVRELLGRYFGSARTIVERYGGEVEKFIGDAVMAVWGSEAAREDDGERAVRAALELVDAVSAFGAEVGAPDLRARAGVVTGQVAALANPGEGIVVGDRVNTASRVQSAAQAGTVLVDDATRQLTAAAILFEDAGEHDAKGKSEPLHLWRAVRVVAGAGGRDREQLIEAAFVGRDSELRLVKELLHATVERRAARLLSITGEAGVGKSRLRREFSNYIDGLADPFLWHLGRCLSYGDGVAFWALAEMVRQRFQIAEDASAEEAARKLQAGLDEWVPDPEERAYIAPRLGALIGVGQAGLDRAELFAGWRLFLERLAGQEPVILVFEDMQWADEGLLEFVEQLLDWSTQVPIFMLTLARPELAARREGWPVGRRGASVIDLEPLGEGAMRALLEGVVDELPREAAGRIVERAQGVPLYAIETVRSLADRGVLQSRQGRLVATGDLGELEVPASLNALLAARLDTLEPGERELVRAMSVFGGSFPRQAAVTLSDLDEAEVDRALAGLVRKQVLVVRADPLSPDRGQYAFAQELLRTVARGLLSRRERRRLHLAAAEHLASVFANEGEEVAEIIATHLVDGLEATRPEESDHDALRARAINALRRAGARAGTVGAPEAAHRAYTQAADLADGEDRSALLQAAGEMLLQAGRLDDALAQLDQAADGYTQLGLVREAAMTAVPAAAALRRLGRAREAVERATQALVTVDLADAFDPDVARLSEVLGTAHVWVGEYEQATPLIERALATAEALELHPVLAEALTTKAMLYETAVRTHEAGLLYAGAAEVARRYGLERTLGRAQNNLANLGMNWDLPNAGAQAEVAVAIARRRGDRFFESLVAAILGSLHLIAGQWEQLVQLFDELLGPDADLDRPGAEYVHCQRVLLHTYRGEGVHAASALAHLIRWREGDDVEAAAMYHACVIASNAVQRDPATGLDTALRTLPDVAQILSPAHEAVRAAWPFAIDAALELGRHQDAHTLIELLADRPRGHLPPYLRAHLTRAEALLSAAEGRHETVERDLADAIDQFAALAYPYWLAATQTDLAAWLIERDRSGEAAPLLEEALVALTPLRAAPAIGRAQQLISTIESPVAS